MEKTIMHCGRTYTAAQLRQEGEDAAIWHGRDSYAGKKAKEEFEAMAAELEEKAKQEREGLNVRPWSGVIIQASADDGKTWEALPKPSHSPFSYDWLECRGPWNRYAAPHGTVMHLDPADALADEVAWRNKNRTPGTSTIYRIVPFKS